MSKKIVIVESPSKSKTIEKYLGSDYIVTSSKGHVRDLATSGKEGLGVDVENKFIPKYVINKDKRDVVKELKQLVKESDDIYLATEDVYKRQFLLIIQKFLNKLNESI